MQYKLLNNSIYCLRLDKGEEILTSIKKMCAKVGIKSGYFNGIGAAGEVTLGIFNTKQRNYVTKHFHRDFEITSLIGNITIKDDEIYLHTHINLSDQSLKVVGGHLISALVSLTCEIFIVKTTLIKRVRNKNIGINTIKL
jgi:predicted DNA-binding protein with PD1-like motif